MIDSHSFTPRPSAAFHSRNDFWKLRLPLPYFITSGEGRGRPGYEAKTARQIIEKHTRIVPKLRNVLSDIEPMWVHLLAECDGAEVLHGASDEGWAGTSHPASRGHTWLKVQQHLFKQLLPLHPALPEITPGQEDGHRFSVQEENSQIDNSTVVYMCSNCCLSILIKEFTIFFKPIFMIILFSIVCT